MSADYALPEFGDDRTPKPYPPRTFVVTRSSLDESSIEEVVVQGHSLSFEDGVLSIYKIVVENQTARAYIVRAFNDWIDVRDMSEEMFETKAGLLN